MDKIFQITRLNKKIEILNVDIDYEQRMLSEAQYALNRAQKDVT